MSAVTIAQLNNAALDCDHIADIATSAGLTATDRLGRTKLTLQGALSALGYQVPVAYAAGINLTAGTQTVEYDGLVYVPKIADLPFTTSGTFETAKFRPLPEEALKLTLATSAGAGMVGSQQALTGSVTMTQQQKNSQIVHVDDWGGDLEAAIDNSPAGSILLLGAGPYVAKYTAGKSRSDLTIRGVGMPRPNTAGTALEGGTIIQGTFWLSGNNLTFEDFGVDSGSTVCAAINGGNAMDAMVCKPITPGSTIFNIKAKNIYGMCKEFLSAYHAVLLEGIGGLSAKNIKGRSGFWGVVVKATGFDIDSLYGYANSQGGVVIKSDSYANCKNGSATNLFADDLGTGGTNGVYIWAETAQLENINISNVTALGYSHGVRVRCAPRATFGSYPINDVNIDNVNAINQMGGYGLWLDGAVIDGGCSNINVINPSAGTGIRYSDEVWGAKLTSATVRTTAFNSEAIYLGGKFQADNITATTSYDHSTPSGIYLSPDSDWRIQLGSYYGTLNLNGGADRLQNGWTAFGVDVPRAVYRNGTVYLTGRINVPSTPWTGKEDCYSVPIPPRVAKQFTVGAYDGTKIVPVAVTVRTDGFVRVEQLNTSAAVPASTTYISLSGISYTLDDD